MFLSSPSLRDNSGESKRKKPLTERPVVDLIPVSMPATFLNPTDGVFSLICHPCVCIGIFYLIVVYCLPFKIGTEGHQENPDVEVRFS